MTFTLFANLGVGLCIIGLLFNQKRKINQIQKEVRTMATSIVTRDQFDAALTAAIAVIEKGFADLLAKIAAGTVTTPEDFSAELTTLQGGLTAALNADPAAGDPPTTPAPVDAPPAA